MKKLIALLLAAVMLLSLAACGGSGEPIETAPATTEDSITAPTETPTEVPTESAYIGLANELLQSSDTVTESYSNLSEYEDKLHELGYLELNFGTDYCKPTSLTYNRQAFCFVFTYFDDNKNTEDKWMMYGTKSDSNKNITEYSDEYLNNQTVAITLDFMERVAPESIRKMDICPQITEKRSQDNFNNPSFALGLYSIYYPTSNNLYNCYREGATFDYAYIPGIIKPWNWVLDDYFANLDLPEFSFCVHQLVNPETKELAPNFNANTTLSNIYCPYEPEMTIKDWVDSPYNFEGWTWFTDGSVSGMMSPDPKNGDDFYVVLAEYHEDGSLYRVHSVSP